MWGVGSAARPGMFAAHAAWSAREIELQALASPAALAQISTPSAAHFLKSHQLLEQKFAADRNRQKGRMCLHALKCLHARDAGPVHVGGGVRGQTRHVCSTCSVVRTRD